jgi:tetratricopeptide (TPR) repeat protein
MSDVSVQAWLRAGITAVKTGNLKQGRELLEAVLVADERNEMAWLWLSGAVETDEERQICLENVLTINPENGLAQKGLAKLAHAVPPDKRGKYQTVRREYTPISTASALLYPGSHIKTWEWRDPTAVPDKVSVTNYQANEKYSDIWTRDVPMCGYCAQELTPEDSRCPNCKKQLMISAFRYPNPSSNLTMLWVLLLGLGQLLLLQGLYHILGSKNLYAAVGNGLVMALFVAQAVGVLFRQNWAHLSAIYSLTALILFGLMRWVLPPDLVALGIGNLDPAIQNFIMPLTTGLGEMLRLFILVAAVLALYYAVVKAGPDFDRITMRQVAALTKGPTNAADFNAAATQLARNGLWATAVLHWQNAAAKAPQHIAYQESLGRAYAQLGFFERSLDVLQAAVRRTGSPERQATIQQHIQAVQAKMGQQTDQPKQS